MRSAKHVKREHYNKFFQDQDSAKYYKSALWKETTRMTLNRDPLCESCRQAGRVVQADVDHYIISIKKGAKKLELDFLVSLCHECHNAIESEMENERNQ